MQSVIKLQLPAKPHCPTVNHTGRLDELKKIFLLNEHESPDGETKLRDNKRSIETISHN